MDFTIMAETLIDSNIETFPAPCPACSAPVRYIVARRAVHCPVCFWDAVLTEQEASDFLFAATGYSDLDLDRFLRTIAERPLLPPPRTLASGKQLLPAPADDEVPWHRLIRLAFQALINDVRVVPLGATYRLFKVSSQERDGAGGRTDYLVRVDVVTTCSCQYGTWHPGEACAHIGATYLFLTGLELAAPVVAAPVSIQARATAAYQDLFGAA